MTYAPSKFEVATSKGLGGNAFTRKNTICFLTLTLGSNYVTQNIAWFPLHHATYALAWFEFATSNALGGDSFKRNKYYLYHKRCSVHHVTCVHDIVKLEVATSNGLREDTCTITSNVRDKSIYIFSKEKNG